MSSAVLALKRAAGRLIHDLHDRGAQEFRCPRLTSQGYGKVLRASVPPMTRTGELASGTVSLDDAIAS